MISFARLILTLWAGSLWTVCGLVVPMLFWEVFPDDRKLAGNVATQFFYVEVLLSVVLGVIYLWLMRGRLDRLAQRAAWTAIAAPALFYVGLRPVMASLRAAGDMARFGQLHSLSSLLFLIACIATGLLVWRSARSDR